MKPLTRILVLANLFLLLAYLFYAVRTKETILTEGELLLFELAPVDPRSLIQGDYMELRYAVADGVYRDSADRTGYLVVSKDADGVAQKVRLQPETTPLSSGELLIRYSFPGWQMKIGAESYFFEEGTAGVYEAAKYGGLRIDDAGNSLLIGLYDENRQLLPTP